MIGRQRLHFSQTLSQGVRNLSRVTAGPDSGTVDASTPAIDGDAFGHEIEILRPMIDLVISDEDLGESGTVRLHAGIAAVTLDRCCASKDQAAIAAFEDRRSDIGLAGIKRDGLSRDAGFEE